MCVILELEEQRRVPGNGNVDLFVVNTAIKKVTFKDQAADGAKQTAERREQVERNWVIAEVCGYHWRFLAC